MYTMYLKLIIFLSYDEFFTFPASLEGAEFMFVDNQAGSSIRLAGSF